MQLFLEAGMLAAGLLHLPGGDDGGEAYIDGTITHRGADEFFGPWIAAQQGKCIERRDAGVFSFGADAVLESAPGLGEALGGRGRDCAHHLAGKDIAGLRHGENRSG